MSDTVLTCDQVKAKVLEVIAQLTPDEIEALKKELYIPEYKDKDGNTLSGSVTVVQPSDAPKITSIQIDGKTLKITQDNVDDSLKDLSLDLTPVFNNIYDQIKGELIEKAQTEINTVKEELKKVGYPKQIVVETKEPTFGKYPNVIATYEIVVSVEDGDGKIIDQQTINLASAFNAIAQEVFGIYKDHFVDIID